MKIWVVGRNYPDKKNNRQGSFELEQAKMLAKRGNDVSYIVCVLHPFWRVKTGGFVHFVEENVNIYAYSGFFTPHMVNPPFPMPYFPNLRYKKWKKLLSKVEEQTGIPDVIHIHFPLSALCSEVFEELHDHGCKVIVTEHWSKVQNKRLDMYEKSQMQSYIQLADKYMAVGYLLRRAIIETTNTKRDIEVLPNIINDVFRMEERPHCGFRFGVVGRLSAEKQIDKIIFAFAAQFKGNNNVSLIIVGDGKERRKLERMTETLKISNQVDFRGSLSRNDTGEVVKSIDCLVCFSKYETFGVPIIEAWACGVPVITTTADSITEKWNKKMGISIKQSDVDKLEEAMAQMVREKSKYDKAYISEYAIRMYSEDNIFDRLMEIYKQ